MPKVKIPVRHPDTGLIEKIIECDAPDPNKPSLAAVVAPLVAEFDATRPGPRKSELGHLFRQMLEKAAGEYDAWCAAAKKLAEIVDATKPLPASQARKLAAKPKAPLPPPRSRGRMAL